MYLLNLNFNQLVYKSIIKYKESENGLFKRVVAYNMKAKQYV